MTPQPNELAHKVFQEYKAVCGLVEKTFSQVDFEIGFLKGMASRDPEVAELKKRVEELEAHCAKGIIQQLRIKQLEAAREKAEAACAEMREALKRAQAAMWDSHYGKGIDVEYARNVDRCIRKALPSSCGESVLRRLEAADKIVKIAEVITPLLSENHLFETASELLKSIEAYKAATQPKREQ